MSRKKRSSPQLQKEFATAASVTPKTYCSEYGAESITSSVRTQSSQEHSTSGFTPPVTKKRRNTFGSRKAPHVYDSVPDDFFFSPSILCRKNLVKNETKEKGSKDNNMCSSLADSADKSSYPKPSNSDSHLCGKFLFAANHGGQEAVDPILSNDSVNGSFISEGSSINDSREFEPRDKEDPSQNNEFDFDDTTTIHFSAVPRRIKQPSTAMTSLDEARAYFARLDASPLLIEAVDDNERRRKVVRTRRRMQSTHPMVMKEYRDYENACECAQVRAMLLEDFARNRKKFHAQDVLYEGFLDEED